MKPKRSLPVLLVSACDRATAEDFISELIDNEVTATEGDAEKDGGRESVDRVWRLVNKYYSADVLVRAHGDSDPPLGLDTSPEAHVAYFTSEECKATAESLLECAQKRTCANAAVRVAALQATREGALGAWATRALYEPVLLQLQEEGMPRLRDALQAHPWPGLRRLDRTAPTLPFGDSDESSSGGEGEEEDGDEGDVERAEQFALALGALGDAASGAGALSDADRRERAEQLLAAFCRALGHRLDC